jgi:beta-glucosidase
LQEAGVLPSVKHFVGDGGTSWQSTGRYSWLPYMWQAPDDRWSLDQGAMEVTEEVLRQVHLRPYAAAIAAGAKNIMVSYSSWNGLKMHGHKYLLTDVLKGELGFEGFLVSDFMAINQLAEEYYECVVQAINAGMDMIMVPFDAALFIGTLIMAVEQGDLPLSRIDDAVRRILLAKFALGLFENPFGNEALLADVGSKAHRAVARTAVQKSLVLLKNESVLPLTKETNTILVAGQGAHDIGLQLGGWSITWQGEAGATTLGGTILEGIKQVTTAEVAFSVEGEFEGGEMADIGIVVVAEKPYAEGEGDKSNLLLLQEDVALIGRLRRRCHQLILILLSGRPLIITDQLDHCDAVIAAWLPGTEGQAIAPVLFGDVPFSGKLAYTWPRSMSQVPLSALAISDESPLYPFAYGLTTG